MLETLCAGGCLLPSLELVIEGVMISAGSCRCGAVRVTVVADEESRLIQPRICDCDYCKRNPSSVISHPSMVIEIMSRLKDLKIESNGDALASFYRCPGCNSLIVVACEISGKLRGAVNADILDCVDILGEIVNVSPKRLSAEEKIDRWDNLWGTIREKS